MPNAMEAGIDSLLASHSLTRIRLNVISLPNGRYRRVFVLCSYMQENSHGLYVQDGFSIIVRVLNLAIRMM